MESRLLLIGGRGAGKTTVGRLLAATLHRRFIDTDELVESAAGTTITLIFREHGESRFREMESQALQQAILSSSAVIATGGGVVLSEKNRELIRKSGRVVWLQADIETMFSRTETDDRSRESRPKLTTLEAIDELRSVMSVREPLYRELADLVVKTDQLSPEAVVSAILAAC